MADAKISALTELAEAPAAADELVVVDKSDTTDAASGTTKRVTATNALSSLSASNLDAGTIPAARIGADTIDAITEIAAALKSGADGTLVTGTAGTSGNLAQWNADGDVVDASVATPGATIKTVGKETIWIPAGAMRPTVSNGCAALADAETTAGRPDMTVLDFDATADEHAQFQVAFPKSWDEGTVTFQAFWTTTATDTDGVAWGLQGVAVSDGDTIDVAYGAAVVVTDAGQSTAEDLYVTGESAAVTIAGTPAAADVCYFRVFRDVSDAADTMTEDARLVGIKLHFTTDAATDA